MKFLLKNLSSSFPLRKRYKKLSQKCFWPTTVHTDRLKTIFHHFTSAVATIMMMIAIGMLVFVWVMARLPRMKGCGQVIHLWVTLINVRIDGSVETQRIVRWWAISVVAIRMTDGRRIVYTQVSKLYTNAPTGLWPNLSRFKGQVQAEIAPCTRRTVFVGKLNFGHNRLTTSCMSFFTWSTTSWIFELLLFACNKISWQRLKGKGNSFSMLFPIRDMAVSSLNCCSTEFYIVRFRFCSSAIY